MQKIITQKVVICAIQPLLTPAFTPRTRRAHCVFKNASETTFSLKPWRGGPRGLLQGVPSFPLLRCSPTPRCVSITLPTALREGNLNSFFAKKGKESLLSPTPYTVRQQIWPIFRILGSICCRYIYPVNKIRLPKKKDPWPPVASESLTKIELRHLKCPWDYKVRTL